VILWRLLDIAREWKELIGNRSRERSCVDIVSTDLERFPKRVFRTVVHPLRKCTCKIYGDLRVTYLHVTYKCAHVTHLTYLGRTKTRRSTLFFSLPPFPLFHELVSIKNFVQSSHRSFLPISPPQFFLRRKSFLPIKYSLRIAYVSRARISRKICQDSLVVELLPFIPR